MKIETLVARLERHGITPAMIPYLTDREIRACRFIGGKGLNLLREKFGQVDKHDILSLRKEIVEALAPVFKRRGRNDSKEIETLARMVAAYIA